MKPAKALWGGFARRSGLALVASAGLASAAGRAEAGWFRGNNPDDCAPCTRHARAEWGPAHCQARQLADMDCAGLAAYAEQMRWAANQMPLRLYLAVPAAAPASPAPTPTPTPAPAEAAPEAPTPVLPAPSAPTPTPEAHR